MRAEALRGDAQQGARMKIVIFGLAVSSSWGNGHAALWRGLIRALPTPGTTSRSSSATCRITPATAT